MGTPDADAAVNLDTIEERPSEHEITPTVVTVERTAAAKIFLETYFNELLCKPSPRQYRLHLLNSHLYHVGACVSAAEIDSMKCQFFRQETQHLRQVRVMKARGLRALTEGNHTTSSCCNDYEVVKVLGKGSFGVVRLVREKLGPGDDPCKKQVYAMKVIRKSGMLRTSQEGHLRAERDFLVASEGSRW